MKKVRWKRSTGDFVESHCGRWWITPIYGAASCLAAYCRFGRGVSRGWVL